jgi:hypothetical protein
MPHTIRVNNWSVLVTLTVMSAKVNAPIDEETLSKPTR